jgi:hypothetical protein
VTGTLTRSGGFTGIVTFNATGAPTGVSATAGTPTTNGNVTTAVFTVSVGPAVTPGTYPITITGSGSGVDPKSAVFTLTVTAAGSFTLGIAPEGAISMVQGTSNNSRTINITRTNYTAAITLTAEGLPNGVSAGFAGSPTAGNNSVMTLTATAGATVGGPVTVTVRGSGPASLVSGDGPTAAVEATTTFQLTVTAAGSFTIGLTPTTAISMQQGTSNNSKTVNITRTNYPPAITLTAEGLPNGVSASFAGNPVTGNSSVMTLTATSGAAVGGPTTVTVRGTGPAALRGPGGLESVEATATFSLTITAAPPPGNVIVDLSGCPTPFFARQDGSGPWQVVTGTNNVYQFTVNDPVGGFAYVILGSGTSTVNVQFYAKAQLTAGTLTPCSAPGTKTVNGTITGQQVGEQINVSLGGASTLAVGGGSPSVVLNGVRDGLQDLVAYRHPVGFVAFFDRMGFRRGIDIPPNGSFGTFDMNANDATTKTFAPINATMTVTNNGSDAMTHGSIYYTRACVPSVLYGSMTVTGNQFFTYGAPAIEQDANDAQSVMVTATASASSFRTIVEYFKLLTAKSLPLGSVLPVPVVAIAAGNYKRLQATFTQPGDYLTSTTFTYADQVAAGKAVSILASYAFLGGGGQKILTMPNFSGLAGWNDTWPPQSANSAFWTLTTTNSTLTTGCNDGARVITATRTGTVP